MIKKDKSLTDELEYNISDIVYSTLPYCNISVDNIYGEIFFAVDLYYLGQRKFFRYNCSDLAIVSNIIEQPTCEQVTVAKKLLNKIIADLNS